MKLLASTLGTRPQSFAHLKNCWRIDAMWDDEIVEEVRRVRFAHAAAHGHDLRRIFEDLKQKQEASGRNVKILEPKPAPARKLASGVPRAR